MGLFQWQRDRKTQKEARLQGERLRAIHERLEMVLKNVDILEEAERHALAYCMAHHYFYRVPVAGGVIERRPLERVMVLYQGSYIEGYTSQTGGKPQDTKGFLHLEREA